MEGKHLANLLNDKKPIYVQIKDWLADQIIDETIETHNKIPSTNEIVTYFKVKHITVSKGVTQLVEDGILYKKRGVGMFVEEGVREKLLKVRREEFVEDYLKQMLDEAAKLELTKEDIQQLINNRGDE